MGLKQDLKEAKKWLDEAQERYWGAKSNYKDLEREDGESAEHFKARKAKLKARVERREEIKDTLAKKVDAIKKAIDKKQENKPPANASGFALFDGKNVPAWMVPWLQKSRQSGWTGVVVSGVRTPEYSEQLCYNMCGAPSCPGRCAGRASNHNMSANQGYPYGAIDVSDYTRFESIQWQIGSPLKNDLPIDPVHFSVSGK